MRYSLCKKKGAQGLQPGTPRPNLSSDENVKPLKSEVDFSRERPEACRRKRTSVAINLPVPIAPPLPENLPRIIIWTKNEPFDFGILSPQPCPKIGINVLRKIADYCKEKQGHYPELSLNQWSHICKYKIQLNNPHLSTAYFRIFDILSRSANSWALTEDPGNNTTVGDTRDVKFCKILNQGHDTNEEFKVNTAQFLLFLYIQHFHRLHKKCSVKSYAGGDEPWPKLWAQSQSSNQHHCSNFSGGNIAIPEQQQAEFITVNLEDIIEFLGILHPKRGKVGPSPMKTRSKSMKSGVVTVDENHEEDYRLAVAAIRALSLILGAASISHDREFKWLDECLSLPQVARLLDFDRHTLTVDKFKFLKWLTSNLKINPWGPSSVPIPKVPVHLMTGICIGEENVESSGMRNKRTELFNRNRIFWNTQSYPKAWFLINNIEKQTLLLDSLEPLTSVKIHRCTDSNIYIPGVHNSILIQKCHGLTINLGVAAKVVKIVDCSHLILSGVGRLFIIGDCVSSSFNILTPSSPIIFGAKNHSIQLAPYNTDYPELDEHLKFTGISPDIQKWNKPLELTPDGFPYDYASFNQDSNAIIVRPSQFKIVPFPFKFPIETSECNSLTPVRNLSVPKIGFAAYYRKFSSGLENVDRVKAELNLKFVSSKFCNNSTESINLIYKITLERFKKWLKETGNYDQILGLLSLEKSLEQNVETPVLLSNRQDLPCVSKSLKKFFNITCRK